MSNAVSVYSMSFGSIIETASDHICYWGYPKVQKGVLFAKRSPFREKDLIFTKRTQETCTGLVFTNHFIVLKVK